MPDWTLISVIAIIATALAFDFVNGFHDAANSIATVVSTRVLTPLQGVAWAAFFNFIAAFTFGTAVAHTIGTGLIDVHQVDNQVIFAGLLGAIAWDLFTWRVGLPTSSSHALIGGYAGAAIVKAGFGVLVISGWIKTLSFIVIAPLLGWALGSVFIAIVLWLFRKQTPAAADHVFRRGQLLSAGLYSLGHGGNDAQKTMGIIALVLYRAGMMEGGFHIDLWVVLSCHLMIALGTMFGGWRIIKTMGQRVAKLKPVDGFCAETGAACTLYLASFLGIPVSTTHTITGSIVGIGSLKGRSAVRWGVAGTIVWAWILTIPGAALIAAGTYGVTTLVR